MIIAQLTDLHIREDEFHCQGTANNVSKLMSAIKQLNRMVPSPDAVLITGDLTDHGSAAEYGKLRECLDLLKIPFFVISGNHDDIANFKEAFADHSYLPKNGSFLDYIIEKFPLRLIGLDTSVTGKVGGRICGPQRRWLDERLLEQPERATLIFMHHPPLTTGISGLDNFPFSGTTEFELLISKHPQVERLVCGHVHRSMNRRFGNTIVTTSPSTAFQFTLDLAEGAELTTTMEPSGYLLHVWSAKTGLITHTCVIDDGAI